MIIKQRKEGLSCREIASRYHPGNHQTASRMQKKPWRIFAAATSGSPFEVIRT